ncbi:MAG TPA: hypothetical protein DCL86_12700 [Bacteroidales bacterium]|nr:hypothetical protein [Bacteroidales bacterium]
MFLAYYEQATKPKNLIDMKTRIFIISIALLIMHLTYGSPVNANKKFPISENRTSNINDTMQSSPEELTKSALLPDEPYVNDIPFETSSISARYTPEIKSVLTEEGYIDDIPFNTRSIFEEQALKDAGTYGLVAEPYVNDIPFNTAQIARDYSQVAE